MRCPGPPSIRRPTPTSRGSREDCPMAVSYSSYLKLDELLALQQPRSAGPEHDEMLFIVIHQVYELWFKEMLHELGYLEKLLRDNDTPRALHTLKRVLTVLKVMVAQIDVLETMTPLEFLSFRDRLESSSGFQSAQFRELVLCELVEHLLEPQLVHLVDDDEQDFVMLRPGRLRPLQGEQLVELQVLGVGQAHARNVAAAGPTRKPAADRVPKPPYRAAKTPYPLARRGRIVLVIPADRSTPFCGPSRRCVCQAERERRAGWSSLPSSLRARRWGRARACISPWAEVSRSPSETSMRMPAAMASRPDGRDWRSSTCSRGRALSGFGWISASARKAATISSTPISRRPSAPRPPPRSSSSGEPPMWRTISNPRRAAWRGTCSVASVSI